MKAGYLPENNFLQFGKYVLTRLCISLNTTNTHLKTEQAVQFGTTFGNFLPKPHGSEKKTPGGSPAFLIKNNFPVVFRQGAWRAFHNNKEFVEKHLKALQVGVVKDVTPATPEQERVGSQQTSRNILLYKEGQVSAKIWEN